MALALAQAQSWLAKRSDDIPEVDRDFIVLSRKAAQRRRLRVRALIGALAFAIVVGLPTLFIGGILISGWVRLLPMFWDVSTSVLTTQTEQALEPGGKFMECASCPEMIVVPPGSFMMGSPANEAERRPDEGPQHRVTIVSSFAVGRFEITFDEWDACAAHGGCERKPTAPGGRGRQPVIQVSWDDAREYVDWIAKLTGKPYRLLTEAEWEYAARAGSPGRFSFGDDEAKLGEYARYYSNSGTQPVGSFAPNAFGLYDMHGNVWEWVEDCYNGDYNGAPANGSAWSTGECSVRVLRGGSWRAVPRDLRSASRNWVATGGRGADLGFRVARTLTP
jgi:formylglycine-generating enzyme required for sulfatase activity